MAKRPSKSLFGAVHKHGSIAVTERVIKTYKDGCTRRIFVPIYRFYHKKVIMVWDNLSAHYATAAYFEDEHPDWFDFYFFPTYSLELNPVEQCWHHTKNIEMANFAAKDKDDLLQKVMQPTMKINNDKRLLASFIKHAGLSI